jgi:hypothetical protein
MPFLYFFHKDFQPSREIIQPFQRGRFLFFFASCRQGFGSGGSGSVCIGSGFNQPYVLDPDSISRMYWIRIQSGQWIRIHIRNPDPALASQHDADPDCYFYLIWIRMRIWNLVFDLMRIRIHVDPDP